MTRLPRTAGSSGRRSAELERFFFLDDADRVLVGKRRGDHNRLGFSLQLGTVRFVGLFLADPLDVPAVVVDYLAGQLGIADASSVKRYAERQSTQWEHAAEIRQAYDYRDFTDDGPQEEIRAFITARAWTRAEGPRALFDPVGGVAAGSEDPAAGSERPGPDGLRGPGGGVRPPARGHGLRRGAG